MESSLDNTRATSTFHPSVVFRCGVGCSSSSPASAINASGINNAAAVAAATAVVAQMSQLYSPTQHHHPLQHHPASHHHPAHQDHHNSRTFNYDCQPFPMVRTTITSASAAAIPASGPDTGTRSKKTRAMPSKSVSKIVPTFLKHLQKHLRSIQRSQVFPCAAYSIEH